MGFGRSEGINQGVEDVTVGEGCGLDRGAENARRRLQVRKSRCHAVKLAQNLEMTKPVPQNRQKIAQSHVFLDVHAVPLEAQKGSVSDKLAM